LVHAELSVMPFVARDAFVIQSLEVAGIGDVACLDLAHAQRFVKPVGIPHLLLVIRDAARGFMMPDDFDAPVGRVRRERLQVEIRISLGETEHVAVRIPVTVPADIPALDQYAADAVFGRKVDVLLRLLRRCSVRRARAPGVPADVHAPPDANVLPRLYPGY